MKSESEIEREMMNRRKTIRQIQEDIRSVMWEHEQKYHKEQMRKEADDNYKQMVKDGIIKRRR